MSRLSQIPGEIVACYVEIQRCEIEITKLEKDLDELFNLDEQFIQVGNRFNGYQDQEISRFKSLQVHAPRVKFARKHSDNMLDLVEGSRPQGVQHEIESTKARIRSEAEKTENDIIDTKNRIRNLHNRIAELRREQAYLEAEEARRAAEEAARNS